MVREVVGHSELAPLGDGRVRYGFERLAAGVSVTAAC